MKSFVLLLVCSLVAHSRACTTTTECDTHVVLCGSGWHVHCDHGLCTCAQNGVVQGCNQDSDCEDGIHTCSDFRPIWRCVVREINGVTRGTCSCHRD